MASSPEFVAFAVELLSAAAPVEPRRMFGGHGLYACGVMFALLDDDELFLKTDEQCRAAFEAAGCRRWVYAGRGKTVETSYFRPPDEAHDSPEAMRPWAEHALGAARRAADGKRTRKQRRGPDRSSSMRRAAPAEGATRIPTDTARSATGRAAEAARVGPPRVIAARGTSGSRRSPRGRTRS